MVIYRGKYELDGLGAISPQMKKDLDKAFFICETLRSELTCHQCGKCCHQPNIIVRPEEVERISAAAGTDLYTFMTEYVYQTPTADSCSTKRKAPPAVSSIRTTAAPSGRTGLRSATISRSWSPCS